MDLPMNYGVSHLMWSKRLCSVTRFNPLNFLIAAMPVLLFAACSSQKQAVDPAKLQETIAEYRVQEIELVRSTVADQERADRLVELLAKRDQLISEHTDEIRVHREQMTALNADYNAERESFEALLSIYNSQRAAAQHEFTALIDAMKKETTADEWKVIAKFQRKRLNPRKISHSQLATGD